MFTRMCKKGKVIIIIIAATIWGALTVGQTLCQALWFSTDALTGLEATKISIYHLLGLQVRSQAGTVWLSWFSALPSQAEIRVIRREGCIPAIRG